MRRCIALVVILALPAVAAAQKIGVLPFEDASGVGESFGENVAKFVRSEFLKNKKFTPKFIKYKPAEGESAVVDLDRALELGKKNGVDYVVIGTILEAEATSSSSGIGGIQVLGQSVGSSMRTVSANVTIQGDLISVKTGTILESFRTDGSSTDRSVGADVSTEWGSVNADAQGGDATPNTKALHEAVKKLVEEITEKLGES